MKLSTNILVIIIFSLYVGIYSFSSNYGRIKRLFLNVAANSDLSYGKQVYGVATYDALFKSILSDSVVRTSFFKAFIPDFNITNSTRLDENMNPRKEYQLLRKFMNDRSNLDIVETLKNAEIEVRTENKENKFTQYSKGTDFVKGILELYGDIMKGFPKEEYNGAMDFVCELDTGEYILVETQVVPQEYWNRRALAYAAAFYGNQLRKGDSWKYITRVLCINILGGGLDYQNPWPKDDQLVKHYRMQEQIRGIDFMDGIEIFQYSLAKISSDTSQEQQDWLTFLRNGHLMTEADVEKVQTTAVRRAYDRAKLKQLSESQTESYFNEESFYNKISGVVGEEKAKGIAEGRAEGVAKIVSEMLARNITDSFILENTGLTEDELLSIKLSISQK